MRPTIERIERSGLIGIGRFIEINEQKSGRDGIGGIIEHEKVRDGLIDRMFPVNPINFLFDTIGNRFIDFFMNFFMSRNISIKDILSGIFAGIWFCWLFKESVIGFINNTSVIEFAFERTIEMIRFLMFGIFLRRPEPQTYQ